jgi:5-hydroxyisourate hydrolase-like protein (transthyretin family)
MKALSRYLITLAVMVISFAICAVAQPQTKPNKKTQAGQISGNVTVRGKPAGGIAISVRMNNSNSWSDPQSRATTDDDGKYHIEGLSPGTYVIAPIAWAFVSTEPDTSGWIRKQVVVSENESLENLDFALVRGGVITGKVTDANGHPVIEESVNLMLDNQGTTFYASGLTFQTDDRGIYRMFGIPAGRFKVSVGQGENDLNGRGSGRTPFRKTFFPDATDAAKANVVEVTEGAELNNIDITVGQRVNGFSAGGTVVDDETGKPVTNVMIKLTRTVIIDANSTSSSGGGAGHSDHRGEFRISNLVPGHYSLSIAPTPGSDLRADPVAFNVVDQDVRDLRIKTSLGGSISGRVVIEGPQDNGVAGKLAQLHIGADVQNESDGGDSRLSQVNTDGSFRIAGLPAGNANFSLSGNQIKGFAIVRIELNGTVQPNEIQIKEGEHLTGVRVIVAYGTATIRGVVKLENGILPVGGRLSVHLTKPVDPVFSEGAGIDARGHFLFESLVAGSYDLTLYLFGAVSPQRPRSVKQPVNVAQGAVTEVMMTMDLKQSPTSAP